jgi:predicted nucleic acid-binding protein
MPALSGGIVYFADTNVLLYALDSRNPEKQAQAAIWMDYLWASGHGRLSWQVLNEFYTNAIRKTGVPTAEARLAVALFSKWRPGGVSMEMVERAWYWMDQAQIAWWDAMIVASAERQGCAVLLSEDFQAGRKYGSVEVINPFQTEPPVTRS